MKISASVYSNKEQDLPSIIKDLDEHQIDFFHIDCEDRLEVFDDITEIRKYSDKPIDLHIITAEPERFYDRITKHNIEFVTFQYEDLKQPLDIPKNISAKLGLAISSDTDVAVFEPYADRFDFILIMATTPGKSGGSFNKENFKKIRAFRKMFPGKKIHVDGGVNGEVSFILRNMGVYAAVSGSYLFNSAQLGTALLNLKTNEIQSHFQVKDFMVPLNEVPLIKPNQRNLGAILKSIDDYQFGFTILVNAEGMLEGIISNADIRKGLLKNLNDLNNINTEEIINRTPKVIDENNTVMDLLHFVKRQNMPITYLPVIDENRRVCGCITFINLIKGEL